MTAFSRLQLAAALLEYDNDPDDPNPPRKAEHSALFSHIRTRNAPRARTLSGFEHLRETPNLLGVELPVNEAASKRGSMDARRSMAGTRNSRGSIDVLRNPFGGDDAPESEMGAEDEEYEEEDLEVDLEAWGMANLLGEEKRSSKNRRTGTGTGPRQRVLSKTQSDVLPNANEFQRDRTRVGTFGHRQQGNRAQSMGGFGVMAEEIEALRGGVVASEADFRRRTISGPLDIAGGNALNFKRSQAAVGFNKAQPNRALLRSRPHEPSPQPIPFPSAGQDEDNRSMFDIPMTGPTSRFDPKAIRIRALSSGSRGSQAIMRQEPATPEVLDVQDDDIFGPLSDRASRFDPKPPADARPMSMASIGGTLGTQGFFDDPAFSARPPSPARSSRFDPKVAAYTRTRAMSDASLGSRIPLEADRMSADAGQLLDGDREKPRRFSRLELMRPKVLIMPSPLQGRDEDAGPAHQLPAGFELSTIGPPLPPGAKSAGRPVSQFMPSLVGQQPSLLTPNPRMNLSLAQLTFRNSLMTDGQRDVAFADIENNLRRAQEDGEQILQEEDIEEEIAEEQKQAQGKAPGKLYGRSLMDELEARKEKLKSKKRVFTGDERPSMMSRGSGGQLRHSGTLIDPATLQERPGSRNFGSRPGLTRRLSSGAKPLLNFSDEAIPGVPKENGRVIGGSKSVFGVDQLWERELEKLKEIEAAESAEAEELRHKEEMKAAKKGKSKTKNKQPVPISPKEIPRMSKVADLPPTLPVIAKATTRREKPPVVEDSDSEIDSEASENEAKVNAARLATTQAGWESSDDEGRRKRLPVLRVENSESEDDVPLARVLQNPSLRPSGSDSEDEQPLAKVLERKSMVTDFQFHDIANQLSTDNNQEDEDDTPLAIRHPRASAYLPSHAGDEDEDDKPLGLQQLPQQQAQLNLVAQQNLLQQQQMMMMQPTMSFGAPSMMSGYSPFLMSAPTFSVSPALPVPESQKYQTVDRWRHNIE
ncbi:hypothetical protein BU17DRAFT_71038 [Hysterangium stoloniferum]|nr:hypothetical protein BU17DRAFT_71038 [Hysterangium stoloniferum]